MLDKQNPDHKTYDPDAMTQAEKGMFNVPPSALSVLTALHAPATLACALTRGPPPGRAAAQTMLDKQNPDHETYDAKAMTQAEKGAHPPGPPRRPVALACDTSVCVCKCVCQRDH
jgi:hypothetical protein